MSDPKVSLPSSPSLSFVSFKYEPLPTPTSIRLLEILPSQENEIWCSLETVDLEDKPVFDAPFLTRGETQLPFTESPTTWIRSRSIRSL